MSEISLIHGDCLEEMKKIRDKSIDMILCDPPYGTTACKWDIVIPFEPMWEQLNRIIKDDGAIVLFGSEPFSSQLRCSNLEMYKYDWIWDKNGGNNFLDAKCRPNKIHEIISVFSKYGCSNGTSRKMKYYPQDLIPCNKITKRGHTGSVINNCKYNKYVQTFTNYPRSILLYGTVNKFHPTQKPIALLEYLIKTYTLENETVLDFTMGSGSTGVACKNINRNFIGIELDEKYFNIAKQRIENGFVQDEIESEDLNKGLFD